MQFDKAYDNSEIDNMMPEILFGCEKFMQKYIDSLSKRAIFYSEKKPKLVPSH